ncbi:MAG: topoisomerase C-terminal repeat-containing protein, partial [Lachnospiraceae bacterium]|nr:topoisomerase C-terminal repeat-containing protein [Lachnospiraceae bacterium]
IGVPCPNCGGEIATTPFGYGCSNYKKDGTGCKFAIGKIAGKDLNDAEVTALLTDKKTPVLKGFTGKTGKPFDAALKLNEYKQIVFDFAEREPPTETNLACPRCKAHKLKKGQWYLECACGFRVRHIVAQAALSEETMQELFTNGKTKNKVTGFLSKTGKPFDAFLIYEKEEIKFDFDNANEKT